MNQPIKLSLLCGGQSSEHEISIISAKTALQALDAKRYDVSVIYITQQGAWYLLDDAKAMLQHDPHKLIEMQQAKTLSLLPGHPGTPWCLFDQPDVKMKVDCVFPILHGSRGEDGTLQGLLDILGVPYVGCGALASAICMEKHITKSLLLQAGINTAPWCVFNELEREDFPFDFIQDVLGDVVFVKPANAGSSVGISKVRNADEFTTALDEAFRYHSYVIVEQAIVGREIECSVIGNHEPIVSLPGEVICHHEFYSYEAKYLDPNGADVVTPAKLDEELVLDVQEVAREAYRILQCNGMARIDFFVERDGQVWVNEVNPIPGMTPISLFSKNWEVTGLPYAELLDNLIKFALEHHRKLHQLSHVRICSNTDDMGDGELRNSIN